MSDTTSAYRWVIAWVALALILMLLAKFRAGYTIIYYLAVITLVFLLLTQYQALAVVLQPFSQKKAK